MDNLTHSLVGLTAAKAGLERLSPGATAVCVLAANGPDADVLATLGGRWFYLQNHRGITHSIVGTLFLSLLIPTLFYLGDRLWAHWRKREQRVRFKGLLLASVLMSLSHPLLDWTNNYGVRPLLPWNGRWFYGDLVFIVDPWLWLVLGGAAFLLTARTLWRSLGWAALGLLISLLVLLSTRLESAGLDNPNLIRFVWLAGLVCLAVLHRFRLGVRVGPRLAIGALVFVVIYWGALFTMHRVALRRASETAARLALPGTEQVSRVAAMPTLANPLRWHCLAETDRATYVFDLRLDWQDDSNAEPRAWRYEKPAGPESALIARAAEDDRARVLLGFARFPFARVEGDCASQAIVQFADLRYTEPRRGGPGGFAVLAVPVACPPEVGAATSR